MIWAVDVTGTMSGLLLALLAAHDEAVKYVPGTDRQHDGRHLPGEAKTDASDAYIIAESVRQRGGLIEVEVSATLVGELRLLAVPLRLSPRVRITPQLLAEPGQT